LSLTGLIFTVAFLAGCLLALARHPIFGVVTYIATFFLSPPLRWWGQGILLDVRWSLIAAAVTLLAVFFGSKVKKPALGFMSHWPTIGLLLFTAWLGVQSLWALDATEHGELLSYYVKFMLSLFLIYRCVDSVAHLRALLWTFVLGCFYFGWIAFTTYEGGRFEGFGGAGIGEANAGALTIVIGTFCASALFLTGSRRERIALLALIPIILNGLVTTISRSGFLALAVGGLVFNFFTPKKLAKIVRLLSVLALVMFLMLTGPSYWNRIQSIKALGADSTQQDTGSGRLVIIEAQLKMFAAHPLGCGATCTVVLSPLYMEGDMLTEVTAGGPRVRASHNTYMTMMVEHGIPGIALFVSLLAWCLFSLRKLSRFYADDPGLMRAMIPAAAGIIAAMYIADLFVTYAKFEVRIWFFGVLMIMLNLAAVAAKERAAAKTAEAGKPAGAALPATTPGRYPGNRPRPQPQTRTSAGG
jgi:O-antigen ligase